MNNQDIITNYYQRHRDEIVKFLTLHIRDRNEAQDIVQDLFLRLLCSHQLVTEQTMSSLEYTLACKMVLQQLKVCVGIVY